MVVAWSEKGLLDPLEGLVSLTANPHYPHGEHYTWVMKIKVIPEKGE